MLYTNPILSQTAGAVASHVPMWSLGRQLPGHRGRVGCRERRFRLRAAEGAAVAAAVAAAAGEWMAGDSPPGCRDSGDIDESNMGNLWLWVDFFDIGQGNIHGFLL